MSSLHHKILAWILWIISAAGAAYVMATPFSLSSVFIIWGIVQIAGLATLMWLGGDRTKVEEDHRKEMENARAKESGRD